MAGIIAIGTPSAIFALMSLLVVSAMVSALKKSRDVQFLFSTLLFAAISVLALCMLSVGASGVLLGALNFYPFSLFFIMLLSAGMMLVNTLSYRYSNDYASLSLLACFAFVGMVVVSTSISMLSIFLGLELVSVSTTFMIMLGGRKNVEAAVKLFVLSSVSIAVFSFALALIFPYNPNLMLNQSIQNVNVGGGYLIMLAMVLFAAAMAFETALFPFNLWVSDVYQGSPGNVTALIAGINKKVSFAAFMLIFFLVFAVYRSMFSAMFMLLSIATMLFGNLVALAQEDVKRLFAYSSIAQAGYIMIGMAAATQFGVEASLVQIFTHSFMIIGAFSVVLWLESLNIRTMDDYTGLGGRNKYAAITLTILMLSMAGIPPLLGFDGKFLLFSSAIDSNLSVLAALGVLNSFISVYYYARLMSAMYAKKQNERIKTERFALAVALIAVIVIVVLGLYPQPLISAAAAAAKSITNMQTILPAP